MESLDVFYNVGENGVTPTQGYEDDFAYDLYTSEGAVVPPVSFKSTMLYTEVRQAFDPKKAGMKVNLRSGVSSETPLILSNGTGIVEGTYRDQVKILVRNTFIANKLLEYAFDPKGNQVPVEDIPEEVLQKGREHIENELEVLGFGVLAEEVKDALFVTHVPAGTIYIPKNTRIAQASFAPKMEVNYIHSEDLEESERGENGVGSSGIGKKGE